ncbi:MAG: hypothetical protein WAO35_25450 [Terriglobia bacterium]
MIEQIGQIHRGQFNGEGSLPVRTAYLISFDISSTFAPFLPK